jgi:hypothetical protein
MFDCLGTSDIRANGVDRFRARSSERAAKPNRACTRNVREAILRSRSNPSQLRQLRPLSRESKPRVSTRALARLAARLRNPWQRNTTVLIPRTVARLPFGSKKDAFSRRFGLCVVCVGQPMSICKPGNDCESEFGSTTTTAPPPVSGPTTTASTAGSEPTARRDASASGRQSASSAAEAHSSRRSCERGARSA